MAKEEKKDTIADLQLLRKEFERGQMPLRKSTALKSKLIELHLASNQTKAEKDLMLIMLKRDRLKGSLSDYHSEILNRIEVNVCDEKAVVKVDNAPRVHFLNKDMVCPFYKDSDADRFVVFVERRIPTDWQMSVELLKREERGHFASEDQYPKERKLLHRLALTQKEFDAWFDILDQDLLKAETLEKEYVF